MTGSVRAVGCVRDDKFVIFPQWRRAYVQGSWFHRGSVRALSSFALSCCVVRSFVRSLPPLQTT
jgi:hypothetical protein